MLLLIENTTTHSEYVRNLLPRASRYIYAHTESDKVLGGKLFSGIKNACIELTCVGGGGN